MQIGRIVKELGAFEDEEDLDSIRDVLLYWLHTLQGRAQQVRK